MKVEAIKKYAKRKYVGRTGIIAVAVLVVGSIIFIGSERQQSSSASTGWLSGGCCEAVADGSFATWRGEPVTIAGTWADTDDANQRHIWGMDLWKNWSGSLDLAPGMIAKNSSENMAGAASGAYEGRWREAMANIRNKWGNKKTLYIRPAHEMNGNWYPWSVTPSNVEDFKKAWVRYYNIIQQELVQKGYNAKVVINYNKDPVSPVSTEQMYPGNQYVDVISVDFYDMWPSYPNQAAWDADFMATENGPRGLGTWQAFAKAKGKPIAFPEWGANPGTASDNPFFIEKMHQFFAANAGSGPGQVLYEIYFNTNANGAFHGQIYPTTKVPNAAAKYRSLAWGGGGVVTPNPTPTPPTPTPPTPTPPAPGTRISQIGNLANGKTFAATGGSHPAEPNNPVSHVNDKNESTRWVSGPTDGVTLSTDLGANFTLNKVSILWAGDTTRNYDLQVSANNSNWTTIGSGTTNGTSPQLIDTTSFSATATGRYFRIVAKDRHNTSWGNSIFEMGLYGNPATEVPVVTKNAVLSLAPATGSYGVGNTINVTVKLQSPTQNVFSVQSVLTYPADKLQYVSTTDTAAFPTVLRTNNTAGELDVIRGTAPGSTGVTGAQDVATISFKVIGGNGATAAIGFKTLSGVLTGEGTNILGNNSSGATYTISQQQGIPGDANGDGRVNALDLSALITNDGKNYPPADFNKDGVVGAADMAILLSRWTW